MTTFLSFSGLTVSIPPTYFYGYLGFFVLILNKAQSSLIHLFVEAIYTVVRYHNCESFETGHVVGFDGRCHWLDATVWEMSGLIYLMRIVAHEESKAAVTDDSGGCLKGLQSASGLWILAQTKYSIF